MAAELPSLLPPCGTCGAMPPSGADWPVVRVTKALPYSSRTIEVDATTCPDCAARARGEAPPAPVGDDITHAKAIADGLDADGLVSVGGALRELAKVVEEALRARFSSSRRDVRRSEIPDGVIVSTRDFFEVLHRIGHGDARFEGFARGVLALLESGSLAFSPEQLAPEVTSAFGTARVGDPKHVLQQWEEVRVDSLRTEAAMPRPRDWKTHGVGRVHSDFGPEGSTQFDPVYDIPGPHQRWGVDPVVYRQHLLTEAMQRRTLRTQIDPLDQRIRELAPSFDPHYRILDLAGEQARLDQEGFAGTYDEFEKQFPALARHYAEEHARLQYEMEIDDYEHENRDERQAREER